MSCAKSVVHIDISKFCLIQIVRVAWWLRTLKTHTKEARKSLTLSGSALAFAKRVWIFAASLLCFVCMRLAFSFASFLPSSSMWNPENSPCSPHMSVQRCLKSQLRFSSKITEPAAGSAQAAWTPNSSNRFNKWFSRPLSKRKADSVKRLNTFASTSLPTQSFKKRTSCSRILAHFSGIGSQLGGVAPVVFVGLVDLGLKNVFLQLSALFWTCSGARHPQPTVCKKKLLVAYCF